MHFESLWLTFVRGTHYRCHLESNPFADPRPPSPLPPLLRTRPPFSRAAIIQCLHNNIEHGVCRPMYQRFYMVFLRGDAVPPVLQHDHLWGGGTLTLLLVPGGYGVRRAVQGRLGPQCRHGSVSVVQVVVEYRPESMRILQQPCPVSGRR